MGWKLRLSRWIRAVSNYDVSGTSVSKDGQEKQDLRQIIRDEIRAYLQDPLGFPSEYKGWLPEWITQVGIDVPISQITGFSGFTAQAATRISVSEGTGSATYVDLATVGPTLTGLPDGQYAVFVGAAAVTTSGVCFMAIAENGAAASDSQSAQFATTTGGVSGAAAYLTTLNNGGNNTLEAKYRTTAGTGTFNHRWLIALKYANP
jgi:hypothetical protein